MDKEKVPSNEADAGEWRRGDRQLWANTEPGCLQECPFMPLYQLGKCHCLRLKRRKPALIQGTSAQERGKPGSKQQSTFCRGLQGTGRPLSQSLFSNSPSVKRRSLWKQQNPQRQTESDQEGKKDHDTLKCRSAHTTDQQQI